MSPPLDEKAPLATVLAAGNEESSPTTRARSPSNPSAPSNFVHPADSAARAHLPAAAQAAPLTHRVRETGNHSAFVNQTKRKFLIWVHVDNPYIEYSVGDPPRVPEYPAVGVDSRLGINDDDELPTYETPISDQKVVHEGVISGTVYLTILEPCPNLESVLVGMQGLLDVNAPAVLQKIFPPRMSPYGQPWEAEKVTRRFFWQQYMLFKANHPRGGGRRQLALGEHKFPFNINISNSIPSSSLTPGNLSGFTVRYIVQGAVRFSFHDQTELRQEVSLASSETPISILRTHALSLNPRTTPPNPPNSSTTSQEQPPTRVIPDTTAAIDDLLAASLQQPRRVPLLRNAYSRDTIRRDANGSAQLPPTISITAPPQSPGPASARSQDSNGSGPRQRTLRRSASDVYDTQMVRSFSAAAALQEQVSTAAVDAVEAPVFPSRSSSMPDGTATVDAEEDEPSEAQIEPVVADGMGDDEPGRSNDAGTDEVSSTESTEVMPIDSATINGGPAPNASAAAPADNRSDFPREPPPSYRDASLSVHTVLLEARPKAGSPVPALIVTPPQLIIEEPTEASGDSTTPDQLFGERSGTDEAATAATADVVSAFEGQTMQNPNPIPSEAASMVESASERVAVIPSASAAVGLPPEPGSPPAPEVAVTGTPSQPGRPLTNPNPLSQIFSGVSKDGLLAWTLTLPSKVVLLRSEMTTFPVEIRIMAIGSGESTSLPVGKDGQLMKGVRKVGRASGMLGQITAFRLKVKCPGRRGEGPLRGIEEYLEENVISKQSVSAVDATQIRSRSQSPPGGSNSDSAFRHGRRLGKLSFASLRSHASQLIKEFNSHHQIHPGAAPPANLNQSMTSSAPSVLTSPSSSSATQNANHSTDRLRATLKGAVSVPALQRTATAHARAIANGGDGSAKSLGVALVASASHSPSPSAGSSSSSDSNADSPGWSGLPRTVSAPETIDEEASPNGTSPGRLQADDVSCMAPRGGVGMGGRSRSHRPSLGSSAAPDLAAEGRSFSADAMAHPPSASTQNQAEERGRDRTSRRSKKRHHVGGGRRGGTNTPPDGESSNPISDEEEDHQLPFDPVKVYVYRFYFSIPAGLSAPKKTLGDRPAARSPSRGRDGADANGSGAIFPGTSTSSPTTSPPGSQGHLNGGLVGGVANGGRSRSPSPNPMDMMLRGGPTLESLLNLGSKILHHQTVQPTLCIGGIGCTVLAPTIRMARVIEEEVSVNQRSPSRMQSRSPSPSSRAGSRPGSRLGGGGGAGSRSASPVGDRDESDAPNQARDDEILLPGRRPMGIADLTIRSAAASTSSGRVHPIEGDAEEADVTRCHLVRVKIPYEIILPAGEEEDEEEAKTSKSSKWTLSNILLSLGAAFNGANGVGGAAGGARRRASQGNDAAGSSAASIFSERSSAGSVGTSGSLGSNSASRARTRKRYLNVEVPVTVAVADLKSVIGHY
ncbi:hypothetical protein HDU96_010219 [Phlyctochytrium bullatum]|nr:hypothetical protein HDU96_010219 [Phlyctochytrium bullatum]